MLQDGSMINDFWCVYVSFDRLALKEKSLLKLSASRLVCFQNVVVQRLRVNFNILNGPNLRWKIQRDW